MINTTMLDAALRLAALGYSVLPLHIVDNDVCSCGRADCSQPGKHPNGQLCPNGHKAATRDPAIIRQWWAQFPDANIGVGLERSGLLIAAPDNARWLEEFKRRGLPATMTVQSGSGPGHEHHFYKRPSSCPTLRMCKPREFDILTDGLVVTAPSTTSGPYILLTDLLPVRQLPPAPAWAVTMLAEEEKRRAARPTLELDNDGSPPVRLTGDALARWNGELKRPEDRSSRLFVIAKDLWRAGAAQRTIAAALAERDLALNFPDGPKYAGRSDAAERYVETARNAIKEVLAEAHDPKFVDDTHAAAPASADLLACQDNVAVLRREVADLRQRNTYLAQQLAMQTQILYNPGLRPTEALMAMSIINEVAFKIEQGQVRDDGYVHVSLDVITKPTKEYVDPETGELCETRNYVPQDETRNAKRTVSKATASRVMELVEEKTGLWSRDHEDIPGSPAKKIYIKLANDPQETLRQLMTLDIERESRHGGSKPKAERAAPRPFQCPDHPDADVRIKRTAECAECAAPLGDLPDELLAADVPFQDETVGGTPASVARSNVPTVNNLKREGNPAPIHDETQTPCCPNCKRLLIDAEDRRRGHCSYQCDLRDVRRGGGMGYQSPTQAFVNQSAVLGGGE